MYKILVADDEKDVVSLLQDYFEINDYLVTTAYTGAGAIEKGWNINQVYYPFIRLQQNGIFLCIDYLASSNHFGYNKIGTLGKGVKTIWQKLIRNCL